MFEKEAEEATLDLYGSADDVYGKEDYKQGFKDGAEFGYNLAKEERKANEWHDLEKNPNDLPENKRSVWCYYGDGYGKGFYDKDDGGWWIEGHIYCSTINAWCELPTFNKE